MNPVFLQKVQALLDEFPNESLIAGVVFVAVMIVTWLLRDFQDHRRFRFHRMRLQKARDEADNIAGKLLEADKKHAELMRMISTNAQVERLNAVANEAGVLFLDLRRASAALQAALK